MNEQPYYSWYHICVNKYNIDFSNILVEEKPPEPEAEEEKPATPEGREKDHTTPTKGKKDKEKDKDSKKGDKRKSSAKSKAGRRSSMTASPPPGAQTPASETDTRYARLTLFQQML